MYIKKSGRRIVTYKVDRNKLREKRRKNKVKGERAMAVSMGVLPTLKGETAKAFKRDLETSKLNVDVIKEGRELLRKLVQQRINEK